MNKSDGKKFLASFTKDIPAEDLYITSMQAMVSAQISVRRIKAGLSQKEFAELMGVGQSQISRWESGESNPTIETLARMAFRLNIHINELLAIEPAPVYYDTEKSNIIPFSPNQWRVATSKNIGYTDDDDELKEM